MFCFLNDKEIKTFDWFWMQQGIFKYNDLSMIIPRMNVD
jgi:hypothetical protein